MMPDFENIYRLGPMQVQSILEVGGTIAGETIQLSLVAVVMACNLVGDGLRDALDVRLRRR